MWPQLLNMLNWWQWLVLAAVPPAIVALYFLKLKRRPIEVPSTYLWRKSIEDLHVNTIWQRLRRNLLLLLQLVLVFLAMLAVLRPAWQGTKLPGNRFIFLVDNSASMQATDVDPGTRGQGPGARGQGPATGKKSRLDEAKERARVLIEQMDPGDAAMIISFADTARVEQMFTEDRRQLARAVDAIGPTCRGTSLAEALKVASGLANPGRAAYGASDVQVAEPLPATLFVLSDGKFDPLARFSLGNLTPRYLPIGTDTAENVGIVAFSVRRHELKPDQWQAFARLENFSDRQRSVTLELALDGRMIDADQLLIGGGESRGVAFDLGMVDSGVLRLKAAPASGHPGDDLALDDVAWTVVSPPRRARVLLVTDGNEPLQLALSTSAAAELADLTIRAPEVLKKPEYQQQAASGAYDLVIYDRWSPESMPRANTLFIGRLPPGGGWKAGAKVSLPQIIDVDPAHPLVQWLDLGDVTLVEGTPLVPPPGGSVLVDSIAGGMLAIAPREEFEDAVLGFVLVDDAVGPDGKLQRIVGTNWPIRASFPVFVLDVLEYLGGAQTGQEAGSVRPGEPVMLESPRPDKPLVVETPGGQSVRLDPTVGAEFDFTGTTELGVYSVRLEGKPLKQLAVNLFEPKESDIRPAADVGIGPLPVAAQPAGWESTRREIWKPLLLLGLAVLCLEWHVFSRRVSM